MTLYNPVLLPAAGQFLIFITFFLDVFMNVCVWEEVAIIFK